MEYPTPHVRYVGRYELREVVNVGNCNARLASVLPLLYGQGYISD